MVVPMYGVMRALLLNNARIINYLLSMYISRRGVVLLLLLADSQFASVPTSLVEHGQNPLA